MLNIYIIDEDEIIEDLQLPLPIEHDVETLFTQTKFKNIEISNKILSFFEGEGSRVNDEFSWIDVDGFKRRPDNLSTSCKAALCVANNPDKLVDLIEVNWDGRDAIINFCTSGNILYYENGITIQHLNPIDKIDVKLDNYRFTTVTRLNTYIQDEVPFEPDMEDTGIEKLEE